MKGNRCGGVRVEAGGESLISSAGAALLLQTAQVSALAAGLSPWRAARTVHDPGKTVLDLAVAIALGGDCLADVAVLRAQPEVFGAVASDPTISRLIDALPQDPEPVLAAFRGARAAARDRVWGHRPPIGDAGPASAASSTAIWSAASLALARPGRSSPANGSPVPPTP